MNRATIALVALIFGTALAGTASAQQGAAPQGTPSPSPAGEILLRMTEPVPPGASPQDSVTREDLRELPKPRPDRLPDNVRVTVGVGDPRCLPGEDPLLDTSWARRAPRRR
jgi:hypothetical protein